MISCEILIGEIKGRHCNCAVKGKDRAESFRKGRELVILQPLPPLANPMGVHHIFKERGEKKGKEKEDNVSRRRWRKKLKMEQSHMAWRATNS